MHQYQIVLTGGGTSGHVLPLVAVAQDLEQRGFDTQNIAWIGTRGGPEEHAAQDLNIDFIPVPTGKLRRYISWENVKDFFAFISGIYRSFIALKEIKPSVLFSKGGYVALPVTIAAKLRGITIIVHESDIIPGLANKIAFPFATQICTSYEATTSHLKKHASKVSYTGNPLRSELFKKSAPPTWLSNIKKPILLFLGGSQGAAFINQFVTEYGEELQKTFFIVQQYGPTNKPAHLKNSYKAFPFIKEELPALYDAAEIVVSRSGSILFELAAFKKPSVIIPLPTSANNHQYYNAKLFADAQAASLVQQNSGFGFLRDTILKLHENKGLREVLSKNINQFYKPQAVRSITDIIVKNL